MRHDDLIKFVDQHLAGMKLAGAKLEKALREVEQASRASDDFDAADAAHDLEGWVGEIRGSLKRCAAQFGMVQRKFWP